MTKKVVVTAATSEFAQPAVADRQHATQIAASIEGAVGVADAYPADINAFYSQIPAPASKPDVTADVIYEGRHRRQDTDLSQLVGT